MRPTTKRNRLPLTRFTRVGSALLAGLGLCVLAACQSAPPLASLAAPASSAASAPSAASTSLAA
ncbi:MAG: YncE family protein, partial [Janthinobacterium lividum]